MPVAMEFEVKEAISARINKLEQVKEIQAAMMAGGEHIRGKIAIYPKATYANQPKGPGGGPWYERGFGMRWIPKRGKNAGKLMGRKTSQTLGRRWNVQPLTSGIGSIVGNNATYAPYVQSKEKQTWFHEADGWVTDEQVVEEELKTVTENVGAIVMKVLREG